MLQARARGGHSSTAGRSPNLQTTREHKMSLAKLRHRAAAGLILAAYFFWQYHAQ